MDAPILGGMSVPTATARVSPVARGQVRLPHAACSCSTNGALPIEAVTVIRSRRARIARVGRVYPQPTSPRFALTLGLQTGYSGDAFSQGAQCPSASLGQGPDVELSERLRNRLLGNKGRDTRAM